MNTNNTTCRLCDKLLDKIGSWFITMGRGIRRRLPFSLE